MKKTLVIYYSRKGENYVNGSIRNLSKGNTEMIADYIKEAVGAELFEVVTEHDYAADYNTCIEEAKDELRRQARPALRKMLKTIASYDNIVVAGPCWWGTYPMAIFTQLEALDFTGKNVFPIMTHEGSGLARAPQALKKACKGAKVGSGLAIHGAKAADSRDEVTNWAISHLQ